MINRIFLNNELSCNPSVEQLIASADSLDKQAGECFEIARRALANHEGAVTVRFNNIGLDMIDTAEAMRKEANSRKHTSAVGLDPAILAQFERIPTADLERLADALEHAGNRDAMERDLLGLSTAGANRIVRLLTGILG